MAYNSPERVVDIGPVRVISMLISAKHGLDGFQA